MDNTAQTNHEASRNLVECRIEILASYEGTNNVGNNHGHLVSRGTGEVVENFVDARTSDFVITISSDNNINDSVPDTNDDVKADENVNIERDWVCRICKSNSEPGSSTLRAVTSNSGMIHLRCKCKGENGVAHVHCAQEWFKTKGNSRCEICRDTTKVTTEASSFNANVERLRQIYRMAGDNNRARIFNANVNRFLQYYRDARDSNAARSVIEHPRQDYRVAQDSNIARSVNVNIESLPQDLSSNLIALCCVCFWGLMCIAFLLYVYIDEHR